MTVTRSDNDALVPANAIGARYRYDWQLFADWCTALELSAMPADPLTIAMFLDENQATAATHRRRLSAINTVHTRCGYPAPGTAHALRERLTRRRRPRPDLRHTANTVIRWLPTTGWPGGLFGRRDALLLTLACRIQLSPTQIGRLNRSDVTFDGSAVRVINHGITVDHDPDESPRTEPVAVYLRWARLQAFADRTPSNRWVGDSLNSATPVTDDTVTGLQRLPAIGRDGPLLPSFDQWGHASERRSGLSRRAVTRILTAHLTGTTHSRPARQTRSGDGWSEEFDDVVETTSNTEEYPIPVVPELSDDELATRYEAGLAARRGSVEAMEALTPAFDELDDRADELLARIEGLLHNAMSEPADPG